jgi:hypothetical protein
MGQKGWLEGERYVSDLTPLPKLSKSKFLVGCQCLKRLYLQVHQPEAAEEPDESQMARFAQGYEVGRAATKAFPGGVLVKEDYLHHDEAMARTLALMNNKDVPAIFEGAFIFAGVRIRVDILERQTNGRWRMIEVKSTGRIKDGHYQDVAIQKYVLEGCGVELSEACLMHLNRDYVYDGHDYDYGKLFTVNDLSVDLVDPMKQVPEHLTAQRQILARQDLPEVEPGDHCTNPYECEFYGLCNPELPEHWVGQLPRIRKQTIKELLNQGVTTIPDIPEDFPLSDLQRRVCLCVSQRKSYIGQGLFEKLKELDFPVCFMDFETYNPAIPRYAGMRPFDQIPFQWSVHVPRQPGSDPLHYEFLADDPQDPREPFIEGLLKVLEGGGGQGRIVVYYAGFETSRLTELAGWLPHYASRIKRVQERIWDLHPVVQNHVYHPQFCGSFSLKNVLWSKMKMSALLSWAG